MIADQIQTNLHALFAELRRLKQEELPRQKSDPVQQAYHDERIRGAIRRVEEEIEREMNGMRSSMIEQTAEEIALRVNADEGEQLITNDGINCFGYVLYLTAGDDRTHNI